MIIQSSQAEIALRYESLKQNKKDTLRAYISTINPNTGKGSMNKAREVGGLNAGTASKLLNDVHFESFLTIARFEMGITEIVPTNDTDNIPEIDLEDLPEFTPKQFENILNNLANGRAITVNARGKRVCIKTSDTNMLKAAITLGEIKGYVKKNTKAEDSIGGLTAILNRIADNRSLPDYTSEYNSDDDIITLDSISYDKAPYEPL